jgi:hypothetical protein
MADRVQGAVSFTPIVSIAADDDANGVDAVHHDIKGALGGNMTYTLSGNDRWYYAPNVIVTDAADMRLIAGHSDGSTDDNTDLIGASGSHTDSSEAAGVTAHFTDSASDTIDCGTDDVKFLFVKNTGTSDTSNTTTTNSVYMTIDGTASQYNDSGSIEIKAGEAMCFLVNQAVYRFVIRTGAADASAVAATVNGSTNVRCTVAAVIADGGH